MRLKSKPWSKDIDGGCELTRKVLQSTYRATNRSAFEKRLRTLLICSGPYKSSLARSTRGKEVVQVWRVLIPCPGSLGSELDALPHAFDIEAKLCRWTEANVHIYMYYMWHCHMIGKRGPDLRRGVWAAISQEAAARGPGRKLYWPSKRSTSARSWAIVLVPTLCHWLASEAVVVREKGIQVALKVLEMSLGSNPTANDSEPSSRKSQASFGLKPSADSDDKDNYFITVIILIFILNAAMNPISDSNPYFTELHFVPK